MRWLIESLQSLIAVQGAGNVLTHTPPEWTSQMPEVLDLWRRAVGYELGLAGVVLAVQAYRVMSGKADLWEVIFRTFFMVIIGVAMAFWADQLIHLMNNITDQIGTSPLDIRTESMPNNLVVALELVIALFFAALAWFKGAVGTLFIAVLITAAPYLITVSAIPILEGLGRWWVEEFTTWMLRPFLVALVLRLGLAIAGSASPLQFLFAIVAFWMAWKMDTYCRRMSVASWGSISQLHLLQRGANMASDAFGSIGGAGGGAQAAAPAAAPAAAGAGAGGAAAAAPLIIP